jgi:signal transduction histidine kinase
MDATTAVPIVRDEVALLIRLVEDLQEVALAESGILQIRKRPERLADLVAHTTSAYQLQAAAEGIDLIVHEAPDLPSVMIDAQRISQVLSNIVGNAVHHTPRGGRIEISCSRDRGYVSVGVCDTGSGIPEDELARVFARFRRVDPSRSRATGGSGLGLTIARLLVELHGGEIHARNRPGGGSCFTFTLPAAAPDD